VRFRDDTRGVTVQIGAVLFFATVIVGLSLYQATVVPSQNADVEYRHSQTVQGDMVDLRNSILETASSGNAQTASVKLGTQYPSRVFLMNPPPATGTLSTGQYENNTISVSNVEANDTETRDYINGTWTAPTKYLSYQPNYNEYDGAPSRIHEASFLYNHYDDANVPLTDQLLVDGDTITLVALNGSTSTSQSGTVSVSAKPASAPYQSVQVGAKNANQPITISIPTRLSAGQIRNSTSLGDQAGVTVTDGAQNQVVVSLPSNRTYTLQTARVDVGSQQSELAEHYLTVVDRDDDEVTVEARDRFNNPVSGVRVNASSGLNPAFRRTGVDGQATFEFADGATGEETLHILDNSSERERVSVQVDTTSASNGNGSDAYNVDWLEAVSAGDNPGLTCNANEECVLDASQQLTVTLTAGSSPQVDGGQFQFSTNDTSVGTVDPSSTSSNSNGKAETTLTPQGPGTVYVYASSGGSGDRMKISIENFKREVVYNNDGTAVTGPDRTTPSGLRFSVTNNRLVDVTVTDITVNPENSAVEELGDPSRDEGLFNSEFFVETQTNTFVTDFGGYTNLEETFTLASGGNADDQHTIRSGETAEYTVYEFVEDDFLGRSPVNMTGENVEFTLTFADGTSKTFTVTGNKSSGAGDGTDSDSLSTVTGSTPTSENDALRFDIENTGNTDVTVTAFSISTPGRQNSGVNQVTYIDRSPGQNEVQITGGGTDGSANPDNPPSQSAYATDGTTYSLDSDAVISGGATASVDMGDLNGGNVQLTYSIASGPSDADVTVTLLLSDGSTKDVYLRVTNVNS
jgi:hypothetical protein